MTNLLQVEVKRTERVEFIQPLSKYISKFYSEDPAQYSDDFRELDQGRNDIKNLEPHVASLNRLAKYYTMLNFVLAKFPINENNIRISFPWYNSLTKEKRAFADYNGFYDRACVVFNIGAIASSLGNAENRTQDDGVKRAAALFQTAAGAFAHIQETLLADLQTPPSSDMQSLTLAFLSNLMLAQAQECFWQKAVQDKMKDSVIAKLAAQVSKYYLVAHEFATNPQIKGVCPPAWITHMQAKTTHFKGVMHFRKSLEVKAAEKYGEEIGRLREAVACARKGLESQKNLAPAVVQDLKSLESIAGKALAAAEKDNDIVYHETVPAGISLAEVPPASMVRSTPFADILNAYLLPEVRALPPLFAKLVPYAVHQSASAYVQRKDTVLRSWIEKLETATSIANASLASMNLPASIEALEQPIGLPKNLIERAKKVRDEGGARSIMDSFQVVTAVSAADLSLLESAAKSLDDEAKEDAAGRSQFGERWTRTPSEKLTGKLREEIASHRSTLDKAKKSDAVVKAKIDTHLANIESLCSSKEELERMIPSSTASTTIAQSDPNIKKLKALLAELEQVKRQRQALLEEWRSTAAKDDIVPVLLEMILKKEVIDNEVVFQNQLKSFESVQEKSNQNLTLQENLLNDIQAVNQSFAMSKQTNDVITQREVALKNLEVAFNMFQEITGNLREGNKFYNDFGVILEKLLDRCRDFQTARSLEYKSYLSDIQQSASGVKRPESPPPASASASAPAFAPSFAPGLTSNRQAPPGSAQPSQQLPQQQQPQQQQQQQQQQHQSPNPYQNYGQPPAPNQFYSPQPGYGMQPPYGGAPYYQGNVIPGTWNPNNPASFAPAGYQPGYNPQQQPQQQQQSGQQQAPLPGQFPGNAPPQYGYNPGYYNYNQGQGGR